MTKRSQSLRRSAFITAIGVGLIACAGVMTEIWRFGLTVDSAYELVSQELQEEFADIASELQSTSSSLASRVTLFNELTNVQLFELASRSLDGMRTGQSVTIYDGSGQIQAWAGRPSEVTKTRILGGETFFVTSEPLGLRLIHIAPLYVQNIEQESERVGTIVSEQTLSPVSGVTEGPEPSYRWETSTVTVELRPVSKNKKPIATHFIIELRPQSGPTLLYAELEREELVQARDIWRRAVLASILAFVSLAILVVSASLLVRPRRGTSIRKFLTDTGLSSLGFVVAFGFLRQAIGLNPSNLTVFDPTVYYSPGFPALLRSPLDLLSISILAVSLASVGIFLGWQCRLGRNRKVNHKSSGRFIFLQFSCSTLVTTSIVVLLSLISDTFQGASIDLLHTSLQPWHPGRLAVLSALILLTVACLWTCATILLGAYIFWRRRPLNRASDLATGIAWLLPSLLLAVEGSIAAVPYFYLLTGSCLTAVSIPYARPLFRHASHAARTVTIFIGLLIPALLLYPSLLHEGEKTKQRFVETRFATQAENHTDDLQSQLYQSLMQIDELDLAQPSTQGANDHFSEDAAFSIWRQTDLGRYRLSSAIELYGNDGRLVSRFALDFPDDRSPLELNIHRCDWNIFGETVRFGSEERRVLHAERAICFPADTHTESTGQPTKGSLVVHVAIDYRTLSFISSGEPYLEVANASPSQDLENTTGQDVQLAIYGWGLQPIFSSSTDAWVIDDSLFQKLYSSRESFWTTLSKGGQNYSTYLSNNRVGIYALGYPTFNLFDHLVRLAEIATLVGLVFLLFSLATVLGGLLTPNRYRLGRVLLQEIRTSFYRRLFLAFIAVTLIPVLALAIGIRNYFTAQLRSDIEEGATRTAAVAQRVIEDSFAVQQESSGQNVLLNDDLLVSISQMLDQEINVFIGPELAATSERDLFASGLLPTRTPGEIYSAVNLQHSPSFVMQDSLGSLDYLVAATPVRTIGLNTIVTVPLASRQQDIERQIDNLDRGILLGVTLFVLLGAGIGLYMAERIADPVERLTRATGELARGDFSAPVVTRSADELQRLVTSFNMMAVDLKRQQEQLEKTHRLEAWADMARQVAHDIKNPLTPVQLSAEHLLQVHTDSGKPLGPVLQNCVDTILAQVRLLRQLSSEFSSYATAPTVSPKLVALSELVSTVIDPYLIGLRDRVKVRIDIPNTSPNLYLDPILVGRALANIIDNALHSMPAKGNLDIYSQNYRDQTQLVIADSGVGLDPETITRIFEPYFSTKVSGTGLGMAIAKRNVELNGGTISVSSKINIGTTVTITFKSGSSGSYPEEYLSETDSA